MDLDHVHVLRRWPLDARSGVFVSLPPSSTQDSNTGVFVTVPPSSTQNSNTGFFVTVPPSSTSASSSTPTASLPNLNISNGTCYSSPHNKMDSRFIPCGNAAARIQVCCWEGDYCLYDNTCFGIHNGTHNTYMAGCSDAVWDSSDQYVRDACPPKPAPYQTDPWIGLEYCNNSYEWVACPQASSPTTMQAAGPCTCPEITEQRIVALTAGPTLPAFGSLPASAGGSMVWFSSYTPIYSPPYVTRTTPPPMAPTSAGASTTTTQGTTAPPPAAPSSPTNMPLVIGVSVGVGGFVLLAAVGVLAFYWTIKKRRRRAAQQSAVGGGDGTIGDGDYNMDQKIAVSTEPTANEKVVAPTELEIRPARPWSLRSELDGSGVAAKGEVGEAGTRNSAVPSSVGTLLSPPMTPSLGEMLESSTVSSVQHTGSSVPLQGQLTGQTTGQSTAVAGNNQPGTTQFETLVELEG